MISVVYSFRYLLLRDVNPILPGHFLVLQSLGVGGGEGEGEGGEHKALPLQFSIINP